MTVSRAAWLLVGLVVVVFGTSAAVCASLEGGWPSPATFVLGTIALPFLALGAALVAAAPVLVVGGIMFTLDRAICGWAQQAATQRAAVVDIAARLDALERRARP
jgi:hypothetical protein